MTPADGASDAVTAVRNLIAREPDDTGGAVAPLRRICGAAVRALSASGAAIGILTDSGVRGACAVCGPIAERLADLQYLLGEGPGIDAFTGRRPVLVPDLSDRALHRWPVYGAAARAAGVRAVFAFPLQVGAARLGVMDVLRIRAGPLTESELNVALVFADVTVETLLSRQRNGDAPDGGAGYHAQVFQAQGMVMVQLGTSIGDALTRMRAHAFAADRRIEDVARDVVDGVLRFDRDRD